MILDILNEDSILLRDVSEKIDIIDDGVKTLAHDLIETMIANDGAGLAAVQVGIPIRMIAVSFLGQKNMIMINPIVSFLENEKTIDKEGCLSFPNLFANVYRHNRISVSYIDIDNKSNVLHLCGVNSRCVQHEVDHLNGKLFIDTVSRITLNQARKKQRKSNKL